MGHASARPSPLEAVARSPYDLVLMDVQMPVLDGLAATERIRARLPAVLAQLEQAAAAGNSELVGRLATACRAMNSALGELLPMARR